ncbi:5-oxoprolinase subunit PxpB [Ralstonia solanacearum]|uniref:5-oxoprolinase subunit PxpB n=1 Tax=Ralstonia solanacearum TaxID=305 RepID=UPI0005ACD237|nr:5-oxoprolinase subunit PxpB [Ralstonia solanacearum]AYB51117.1 5-oxoprolinase subunit PxpB [Ralstonia solanacearum]AYB55668.1 5-oxoprolinase subunit PxpB [Ralstonia solanacearum]MBB6590798.1 5-oxoprolinase subunit PxpB [Ralstonia solanacearum]MBB6594996.1 5-oxoprolinase subunit PxpB [Ralstonia solanacearum]MDB0540027.1 5-oxoprolinase subunit PxpB [Ralstonia solanacearum]
MQCTIHRLGELALLCEAPPPATLTCQQRIWAMAACASTWAGVIDVVPGMNNLTLVFGPQADAQALAALLREAWEESRALMADGKRVEIEVAYGGDDGPDLRDVAAHTGLSPAEVVRRHTAPEYIVYFLGFQPGFAYMGGLDKSLATPRRAEPRMAVPAGSVGIGGEQTGIYPAASPGGWQLLGRTDAALFLPERDPPTLLAPGDRIRFVASKVRV